MEQGAFTTSYTQPGPPVYELSGWWRRVGAEIIDGMLVSVTATILLAVLGLGEFEKTRTTQGAEFNFHVSGWPTLFYILASIGFMAGVMGYSNGQTLGMMATGIRVVREDGQRIAFGFAFYRENIIKGFLFGWVAIFTLFIATLLNYLWPLWDDKNQALHDKICNTRVVRDTFMQPAEPFIATPPMSPPPPPVPPGTYQPPPDFTNPVPDDER